MTVPTPEAPWTVAIMIFDGVEVLDFTGPFEVLSRTRTSPGSESRRSDDTAPFRVITVAPTLEPISATGGLRVVPDYGLEDAPKIDILIVPGGFGTRALLKEDSVIEWIGRTSRSCRRTASVCTGSLLLARAGVLDGKRATTHHLALDLLSAVGGGRLTVERGVRWVDDGILTSAGVAAGIDMAFHLVETLCGSDVADETARYIEYPRRDDRLAPPQ